MKPVVKAASPAAIALLNQATSMFPKRLKASDGLLPSAAHQKQNPNSDHNTGLAVDLTHDPKNGVDCAVLFEKFKEDERVEYLIFQGKIWSKDKAKQGNRKYLGVNAHNHHLHVSIAASRANDTSAWFWWLNQPPLVNQIRAAFQVAPTKKLVQSTTGQTCTCCPLHLPKGK